jgi:hypothetical protein
VTSENAPSHVVQTLLTHFILALTMPSLPSADVLQAHGLSDVELNLRIIEDATLFSSSFRPSHREDWVAGWAKLDVKPDFPLLSSEEKGYSRVRFAFCPLENHDSVSRFRRQAQLLALDTIPNQAGPSERLRFAHVKAVLAWWEDEYGLWMITDEDDLERMRLVDWWAGFMERSSTSLDEHLSNAQSRRPRDGEDIWISACDTLTMVVQCLKVSCNSRGR